MLEDTLTIKHNGDAKDLFMSFGLLNELMKIVHDIPNIQSIGVDPALRCDVLEAVFAQRGPKGEVVDVTPASALPITAADAQRILEWVAGHVLDFFLGSVEAAVRTMEPHRERLEKLMPSGVGSGA